MTAVEVLVPWRGGCTYRDRALEWVKGRLPWPTTVCETSGEEWSKGAALWPAAQASSADILVIHDADVWCDGTADAIEAVDEGEPWAMPHERVLRLNDPGSDAHMAGEPWPDRRPYAEPPHRGIWGGGIVVLPRETYLRVPIDPRFRGWGQEDFCWATALHYLAGQYWRGTADLIHLWHPPQQRMTRQRGSPEGWALSQRYRRARPDPNAMRALVDEGRPADVVSRAA